LIAFKNHCCGALPRAFERPPAGERSVLPTPGCPAIRVTMTERDRDLDRVIQLLRHDVAATVGHDHESAVVQLAANVLTFREASDAAEKVVEDVQQYFHDTFVDTTWPACPRHSRHPLWFRDDAWWCEQDGVAIVPLGKLSTLAE
jgi:hypothetical protein